METAEKVLIVNADDLGRTPGINEGIFQAHREGIVTSATLMVNYDASRLAARDLPLHPSLGVGLHVALTGGVPTLPPEQVPSLVDTEGRLPAKPEGLGAPSPEEVLAEVRAQLALFRVLTGRLPTHLDSHHHSHRRPEVLAALVTVAAESNLPVRLAAPEMASRLRQAGVATTDHFVADFFGPATTLESLVEILERLPSGVTELMCHPARVDDELRHGSSYVDEREQELASLTSPEVPRLLSSMKVCLAHFGSL